jgi:hypothetical protein
MISGLLVHAFYAENSEKGPGSRGHVGPDLALGSP